MLFSWLKTLVSTLNSVKGQKIKVGLSCYSWAKTWKPIKPKKKKKKKENKGKTKIPVSVCSSQKRSSLKISCHINLTSWSVLDRLDVNN